MSIKSVYLSRDLLYELKEGLFSVDMDLYDSLDDALKNTDKTGEYLINIFYDDELLKLEKLDKNYQLFKSIDGIMGSGISQEF